MLPKAVVRKSVKRKFMHYIFLETSGKIQLNDIDTKPQDHDDADHWFYKSSIFLIVCCVTIKRGVSSKSSLFNE